MREIVLCADEETMQDPALIGLEGENLASQHWIHAVSGAQEARNYLRTEEAPNEVWVASSNEVDPINLAAALKRDCADKKICLVAWRGSGSLLSRASAAGIDEVLSYGQLSSRYAELKRTSQAVNPRRRTPARALEEKRQLELQQREREMGLDERLSLDEGPEVPPWKEALEPDAGQTPDKSLVAEEQELSKHDATAPMDEAERDAGAPWDALPGNNASLGKRGYALSVVSASGGTGKSTVAVLSALIAASHGYRTLLIDGDLQFGDAAIMLGDEEPLALERVMADPGCLDSAQPETGKPVLVAAPEHLEQFELYQGQLPGLVDRARESFDVVVVNTGSFWTEAHIQLIEASSNTLFLVDQRPTSVKAVRRALELCARCGVASNPFLYAVNRCARNALLSSIDVACALNGASVAELKDGGSEVAELTGAGLAIKLVESRNSLCVSLNDFLGGVIPAALGEKAPDEDARKSRNHRKPLHRRRKIACL